MGNCSDKCGRTQVKRKPGNIPEEPPSPPITTPKGQRLIENLKLGRKQSNDNLTDKYEIDRENPLGRGIGGWVYKAVHKDSGQYYAVKHLKTEGIANNFRKMDDLRTELKLMIEMDHPHIVKLCEVIEAPDGFHLIQELSTGGELLKRINEVGFTEDAARGHILTMINTLRYLHDKKIVHCDLKPENWLFDEEGENARLRLIDFGFSKHLGGAQNLTIKRGSTLYLAPEVFAGKYDAQADMWSLGVIGFMMLFQKAPFCGMVDEKVNLKATSELIKAGKFEFPPETSVSEDAQGFIKGLLTVDPSVRMTAAESQQHAWLKAAYDASVETNKEALPPKLTGRMKSFSDLTSLQRTVTQVLAYMLESEQIKTLRDEFEKLDETRNGEVSYQEFENAFKRSSIDLDKDDLQQAFNSIDFDRTGNIHWHEFIAATIDISKVDEAELEKVFRKLDFDDSGFITVENLKELVGRDMTEAELKGMVNEFGEEAKNEIGRKEFVSMVKDVRRRRKSVMTEGLPGQGVSLDDVALVQSGDDSEEAEGGIMI